MPPGPGEVQGVLEPSRGGRQGHLCTALGHQHVPRWQPRPGVSTWSLVATWTVDTYMASLAAQAGTPPWLYMSALATQNRLFPSTHTHTHPQVFGSTSLHNAQTIPLLFLSHLSTTYLHMVWFPCEQPLHGRLLGVSLPAHAT
jgi:hypothetical protein